MVEIYNDIELVPLSLVDGLPLNGDNIMDEYHFCGSRVSAKTRSIIECIVKAHLIAVKEGKRVITHAFRNMNKDVEGSIFKEFQDELNRLGVSFIESKKNLSFRLGKDSIIHCRGLHTQSDRDVKLAGLAGSNNADLVIRGYEEAFEISNKDRQAVDEAIRDAKRVIEFNSCNPWLLQNHYIQFLDRRMKFDREQMRSVYHQKVNISERVVDKKTNTEYFIKRQLLYTNGRINNYITDLDKRKMIALERIDPKRAEVASGGMPGAEYGAIFNAYLANVKSVDGPHLIAEYQGGIDCGEVLSATTLSLGARDNNFRRVGKIDEGFHSNHDFGLNFDNFGQMDAVEMARQIVVQIKRMGEENPRMKNQRGGVLFFIDNANMAGIPNLKQFAADMGMDGVVFKKAVKIEEYLRIDFIRNLMAETRGYMNERCKAGGREYSTMIGDPRKVDTSNPKMLDADNHTFDADCYALQTGMKQIKAATTNDLLGKKGGMPI